MQLLISSLIVISQLVVRSSTTLLVFLWGLIQLLFIANLFSYFYESQWVNKPKKNDLIKARKLSTDFSVYRWIMAKSLKVIIVISILRKKLGKQNNDEHGAIFFLDLNIKIRDGQFQIGHFDKRLISFSIVRISNNSSNVPSKIVFFLQLELNHWKLPEQVTHLTHFQQNQTTYCPYEQVEGLPWKKK